MPKYTHTEEQLAIIDSGANTSDNLIISALAGSGKTSTLEDLSKEMKERSILCLAFNKKIADEMAARLSSKCKSKTLHSLGYGAWAKKLNRRSLRVRKSKVYGLLKGVVDGMYDQKEFKGTALSNVLKVIREGKAHGFLPSGIQDVTPLYNDDPDSDKYFFKKTDIVLTPNQERAVIDVSRQSYELALMGEVDFDDMTLLPTIHNDVSFDRYDAVLIDEAQDLSDLNHEMLSKIVGDHTRLIAVGDSFQAIYAFRGAEEYSMSMMKERFGMTEMNLTVSFRCAQKLIENVHWRAPDMKWAKNAPLGKINTLKAWGVDDIPEESAIICRNNAPLFSCALNFMRNGVKPNLGNKDIIAQVVKNLKDLGPLKTTREEAMRIINDWKEQMSEKRRDKDAVGDMAECLRVFMERSKTIGDAIKLAKKIEKQEGGVYMSTIHRAKGLEWEQVFILDIELIKLDKGGQEPNVKYVGETRAKEELNYITSEGFTHSYDKEVEIEA